MEIVGVRPSERTESPRVCRSPQSLRGWATSNGKRYSSKLRERRGARHLNQTQVARIVESSQSGIAKMEAVDPSVPIDLLITTLPKIGAHRKDAARTVSRGSAGAS